MVKKNYEELAEKILNQVGGKENISFFTHCMTRLRFNLKDAGLAELEKIEIIPGVIGCQWAGEQLQIIIGQSVADVYNCICQKTGLAVEKAIDENLDQHKRKISLNNILDGITGCITPLIPVLMGAGMIKILIILGEMLHILKSDMPTYQVLNFVGDAGFYFLPVFVGANAAKKFGANAGLGMLMGAIFIHPTFIDIVTKGNSISFFNLPIYGTIYASTIFPTIISVFVMSFVERFIAKYSPDSMRTIIEPFLTILIMIPLSLCLLGPIGSFLGIYLANGVIWLHEHIGFLGIALFTSSLPLLVMTGMHTGFAPYVMQAMSSLGREPLVILANLISNINQGVACVAVGFKTKNKTLKATALSCATTAIIGGVTEPAMFGITLKYKTPLYGAMIGSFLGAAYAGIMNTYAYAIGTTGIFGIALYVSPNVMNLINIIIAIAIGVIATFVATLFLYKDK